MTKARDHEPSLAHGWRILDCTLRDGGYYTGWDFDDELVRRYLTAMARLPVSCIELGYVSAVESGYAGRFYYLTRDTLVRAREAVPAAPPFAVMLNAKNCVPGQVGAMLRGLSGVVDVVRIACDPDRFGHGLAVAEAVKHAGFEVGLNLMYLSRNWNDDGFFNWLARCEGVVDVISLVDSFGACFPDQVAAAVARAVESAAVAVGFHGHDNLTLSFANAIAAIGSGATVIDSTVLGIGRGAGNLRTEILAMHLGQTSGRDVDLLPLVGLLDELDGLKARYRWGAKVPYIVSGFGDLPQKDVMEWLGKKRYSTHAIVSALQGKKLARNGTAELAWLDATSIGQRTALRNCILIGGGETAARHADAVATYAEREGAVIVHSSPRNVDAYRDAKVQQVLCIVGDEASKLENDVMRSLAERMAACVVDEGSATHKGLDDDLRGLIRRVTPLLARNSESDGPLGAATPLGTALGAALALGASQVHLAGFDGYAGGNSADAELHAESQAVLDAFSELQPGIDVVSLTPSSYQVFQESVYAKLCMETSGDGGA